MTRSLADIVVELNALDAADFDLRSQDANGWERLAGLCEELEQHAVHDAASIVRELFGFMERLDGVDIGSPGPVIARQRPGIRLPSRHRPATTSGGALAVRQHSVAGRV